MRIDDVRRITNMSTGRYGAELASEFRESTILMSKEEIHFLHAKHSVLPTDDSIIRHEFVDYFDYTNQAQSLSPKMDIIVSAAAVSDYVVDPIEGKIASDQDEITIKLKKVEKTLTSLRAINPKAMIVGFKLLVDPSYQEIHKAVQKVLNNGADLVVFNDLNRIKKGDNTRLVFNKQMSFCEKKTAKELVAHILHEYFERPIHF